MTTRRNFLAAAGAVSLAGAGRTVLGASMSAHAAGFDPARAVPAGEFMMTPGLVYLNTGSAGPTWRAVLDATIEAWKELETNPVAEVYGQTGVLVWTDVVRMKVAAFLGCDVGEVLITRSTSEAMNTVALGTRLGAGDRVLTTDQEHEGGSDCWRYLAEQRGVVVDKVAIAAEDHDASAIVQRFADALRPETKVISVSHVLWTTGLRMPVAEISALARARGILSVVDGAQAAGNIAVDVKKIGCHAYATTGHKWVLGPKGTGMLYVSSDASDRIRPIQWLGGKRVTSGSTGVGPLPIVVGLGAAIDAVHARGIDAIESRNMAVRNYAFEVLRRNPKLRMMSLESGALTTPFVSFAVPDDVPSHDLLVRLLGRKLVVKSIGKDHFNGCRIALHLFNTERDVDALASALKTELG